MTQDLLGQVLKKGEDSSVSPLVLSKGFVVHEEIDGITVAVDLVYPVGEFFGSEGPFGPGSLGKPKSNVVGKTVVLEQ